MKFSQKFRQIWHDVFYRNASEDRVKFALKCQDVTAAIDLHEKPTTLSGQFRLWLHLSLCRACKNYDDLSHALSRAVKKSPLPIDSNLEKLNSSLLEKHGN
jgi:hypothetical protein